MIRHTQGPWEADLSDGGMESMEIRAGGSLIANVYGFEDFPCLTDEDSAATAEEMKANARLIAAAPQLYEACKAGRQKLVTYCHVYQGDKELRKLLDMWDAAIAKAEGSDAR
jgi:hypothetical protein